MADRRPERRRLLWVVDLAPSEGEARMWLPALHTPLRWLSLSLTVLALLGGAVLLVLDSAPRGLLSLNHAPVSAAPLLLIGLAYVGVQPLMRPRPLELFKQLMLGGAFIL